MFRIRRLAGAAALAVAAAMAAAGPAAADPPPWAPAHGWRHKHKHGGDVVIVAPPAYVVPAPVYVAPPPPVYVAPPPPRPAVYAAPYGIGRGVCDRGLVSKELGGALIGGATGGLIGSQFGKGSGHIAATAAGVALGALVGSSIGRGMDEADQHCVGRTLEYAPDNRAVRWQDPDGARYSVVPVRTWEQDGRYCREYRTTSTVDGRRQQVVGTACRQPDGAWAIVN